MRRVFLGVFVMSVLALAVHPSARTAHADSLALSQIRMSDVCDADQAQPVTQFPSAPGTICIAYSVDTPSSDDSVYVYVYAGGVTSTPATSNAIAVSDPGTSAFALLPNNADNWQDGAYCTILVVNGQPDNFGGQLPIAWTVGDAAPPDCSGTPTTPTPTATATPVDTPTPRPTPDWSGTYQISLNPSTVTAGQGFSVTGSGFPDYASVTVEITVNLITEYNIGF